MNLKRDLMLFAAAAALALGAAPARADIITYNDGKIVKGILEDLPGKPDFVALNTDMGKINIPKARIKSIVKETKAQGLIHLGKAKLERGAYDEALAYFQQARSADPANAEAGQLVTQAEAMIGTKAQKDRSAALDQVDKLAAQARDLIQKSDFTKAEKTLVEANKLLPSPEQKKKLSALISDMYLAWAEDRADKLDQLGAEEKLNLALAANPNNDQVIEKMLKLWENDPQKRQYTARVYETILERHPEDRALELNLANIYYEMGKPEDAVRHYLNLFKASEEYKGTQVEVRLMDSLDRLHRQYAMKRQYDKAIHYFDILAAISPQRANPTEKLYYVFYQKGQGIQPTDMPARLGLAAFAEQNGLDQEALDLYRALIKAPGAKPEVVKAAKTAIDRYATRALANAQMVFDKGDYTMAKTLADAARKDYPDVAAIQEKAAEIVGKAQNEEAKERRNKRELAKAVLARADEYYQMAYYHYQNLFSTERKNIPNLLSDRTQARNYFNLAINAYLEALRIDPSLGTDSQSIVQVKLSEAREILQRLNMRPAPLGSNFRNYIVNEDNISDN